MTARVSRHVGGCQNYGPFQIGTRPWTTYHISRQQISTLSVSGISRFFKQVGAPDVRKPPDGFKELNDAGEAMTDLVGPSGWD